MLNLELTLENNYALVQELTAMARAIAENSDEMTQVELAMAEHALSLVGPLTPIITGSLRSSHAIFIEGDRTFISISELTQNPFSDEDPYEYGPEVHEMGGISHSGHERAFYDVLVRDYAEEIMDVGEDKFFVSLGVFRT